MFTNIGKRESIGKGLCPAVVDDDDNYNDNDNYDDDNDD